jgi:lipid-binding SYLF domain-containing protein
MNQGPVSVNSAREKRRIFAGPTLEGVVVDQDNDSTRAIYR